MKQKKNQFAVRPTIFSACVEIAGSVVAGGFLCQLSVISQKGTLSDKNAGSGWVAMSSAQWKVITGYSRSQLNESISRLRKAGCIEQIRRRVYAKDHAALAWYRVSDSVKSEISEILNRSAISAFSDSAVQVNAQESEDDHAVQSDIPDELVINEKPVNELLKKGIAAASSENKKKLYFDQTVQQIFKGSKHTPEQYTGTSALHLDETIAFLSSNPANYFSFCDPEYYFSRTVQPLMLSVYNWASFCAFVSTYYFSANLPEAPTILALHTNRKYLGEYLKFYRFETGLKDWSAKLNKTLPHDAYSHDHFKNFAEATVHQRDDVLIKIVQNKLQLVTG